jgi:hypothetical protein
MPGTVELQERLLYQVSKLVRSKTESTQHALELGGETPK